MRSMLKSIAVLLHAKVMKRRKAASVSLMRAFAASLPILHLVLRTLSSFLCQETNRIIRRMQLPLIRDDSYSLVMRNKVILFYLQKLQSFQITFN